MYVICINIHSYTVYVSPNIIIIDFISIYHISCLTLIQSFFQQLHYNIHIHCDCFPSTHLYKSEALHVPIQWRLATGNCHMPFRFVANFECATFLKGYTKGAQKGSADCCYYYFAVCVCECVCLSVFAGVGVCSIELYAIQ